MNGSHTIVFNAQNLAVFRIYRSIAQNSIIPSFLPDFELLYQHRRKQAKRTVLRRRCSYLKVGRILCQLYIREVQPAHVTRFTDYTEIKQHHRASRAVLYRVLIYGLIKYCDSGAPIKVKVFRSSPV